MDAVDAEETYGQRIEEQQADIYRACDDMAESGDIYGPMT